MNSLEAFFMEWYSATEIAKILSVVPATVGGLIEDGSLGAINIARSGSVRKTIPNQRKASG